MSKHKSLKEARAAIFTKIAELRTATDGREMTAEEEQRWSDLLADYDRADKAVESEERFAEIERRQVERQIEEHTTAQAPDATAADDYRSAFQDYLQRGATGIAPESRALFEKRAGITGLSAGVIVPETLANNIEIALKAYGGMFEAGTILSTSTGGDLIMPTVNDTNAKASVWPSTTSRPSRLRHSAP